MDEKAILAVVVAYLEYLDTSYGHRCNEVALERSTYLLQELGGIPLGRDTILYKHTVTSFFVSQSISPWVNTIFKMVPRDDGALYIPYPNSGYVTTLKEAYKGVILEYESAIQLLADFIALKGTVAVDLLATVVFFIKQGLSDSELVNRVLELQRHSKEEIIQAISDLEPFSINA